MPVNAVGERDEVEEQPKQEPTDDWYHRLEEEIRAKEANMGTMAAQMDALMAQPP